MYVALGLLQVLIALGAIAGGWMLLTDPSGVTMGFSVSILKGSIFSDFLIPGLFLFAVNGLGSLVGGVLTFRKHRYAPMAAVALGAIMVAWIAIQLRIIRSFHWLQLLYFVLGLVEIAFGMLILRQKNKTD